MSCLAVRLAKGRVRAPAVLGLVLACLVSTGFARAEGPVIEKIEVIGNRRLTIDAFLFASGLKVGEPYDPEVVKKAFRRLWDKGLFDNLKVEVSDGETGKILTFTVKERPLLVSVDYDKIKALTQSNIEDAFKQRSLDLTIGKPVSQKNLWKATEYIKDLLATKGYLDSSVSFTETKISETSVAVKFNIRQGPRTRIKKIVFVGNTVFSQHQLRAALQQVKQSSLFAHIGGKDLWRPALYEQEVQKILELYRSHGYLDVEVKPPVVELVPASGQTEKSQAEIEKEQEEAAAKAQKEAEKQAKKKKKPPKPGAPPPTVKEPTVKKYVYLTVKIKEGPQYTAGNLSVKGNTVFTDKEVLARIPVFPGLVINDSALQNGLNRLRVEYGDKGYIYATVTRVITRKEGNVADVMIDINEDKAYKIDTIEFEGNTVTRDNVLRREMRVNEGDVLARDKVDLSLFKINQLGFIRPDQDPVIEPIGDTDKANIRVKVEEQGRNEIQVGGGYSGVDGFFFQGSYATKNFLGRGDILAAFIEFGGRTSLYSISFTEPYFLGKPYLLGFSIFNRSQDLAQNQTRSGRGGTITLGKQFGNFTMGRLLYSYENVTYTAEGASLNIGSGATSRVSPLSVESSTTIASITPTVTYDRLNNPTRPSAGRSVFLASQIAGVAFGGDNTFWKPLFRVSQYFPAWKRSFFAMHLEGGYVVPFGKGATTGAAIVNVPASERFFIGGEFVGPRIFETRSISPVAFVSTDGSQISDNRRDLIGFKGRNVFGDPIMVKCNPAFDWVNTSRVNAQGQPIEVPGPADQVCNLVPDRVGGNLFFLAQFEYAFPIAPPFTVALFLDAGDTWDEVEPLNFDTVRVSAGIEARIYLPIFQAPVRFIFGTALKSEPLDVTNSFQFSIGTSF